MEIEQAQDLYFQSNEQARMTLKKLVDWDPNLTLNQNARWLGFKSAPCALAFAQRYGLSSLNKKPYRFQIIRNFQIYYLLHEEGYTYQQIGEFFGITRQTVEEAVRRNKMRITKSIKKRSLLR
jgi:hypothetical protein